MYNGLTSNIASNGQNCCNLTFMLKTGFTKDLIRHFFKFHLVFFNRAFLLRQFF